LSWQDKVDKYLDGLADPQNKDRFPRSSALKTDAPEGHSRVLPALFGRGRQTEMSQSSEFKHLYLLIILLIMSEVRAGGYSLPMLSKRNRVPSLSRTTDENNPENQAWKKLPLLKMTNVLKKIGAGDHSRQMYVPNEEEQAEFKKSKWE
jgi:hypothetical protein